MRINDKDQKLEMEERDWNYIMPAYLRSYLFYTKNIPPAEVVFPMFKAVKVGDISIPVRWVEPDSEEAVEVKADASNIPEATEAEIAKKDAEEKPSVAEQVEEIAKEVSAPTPAPEDLIRQQQETIQQLEDETADLQLEVDTTPKEVSAARAAFAEDVPKEEPLVETVRNVRGPEWDALRDRIIAERGRTCQVCGNEVGKPKPIILHHIDGNSNNDADDNLRLVCSECHDSITYFEGKVPKEQLPPITAISEATPQPPQPTAQPTEPATNGKPPAPKRQPKLPPVVIPPGQPLDGMHPRDRADQSRVAKDLKPEPEVNESAEIEQDVEGLKE